MTTTSHVERYAEVTSEIRRLRADIDGENNSDVQTAMLWALQDLVLERNDLWDAIGFRVPEMD